MKRRYVLYDKARRCVASPIYHLESDIAPGWFTRYQLSCRLENYHDRKTAKNIRRRYAGYRKRFVIREVKQVLMTELHIPIGPLLKGYK